MRNAGVRGTPMRSTGVRGFPVRSNCMEVISVGGTDM